MVEHVELRALRAELAKVQDELGALRAEVTRLRPASAPTSTGSPPAVDRRDLLRRGGAVVAGLAGASVLGNVGGVAAATDGSPIVQGQVNAGTSSTGVTSSGTVSMSLSLTSSIGVAPLDLETLNEDQAHLILNGHERFPSPSTTMATGSFIGFATGGWGTCIALTPSGPAFAFVGFNAVAPTRVFSSRVAGNASVLVDPLTAAGIVRTPGIRGVACNVSATAPAGHGYVQVGPAASTALATVVAYEAGRNETGFTVAAPTYTHDIADPTWGKIAVRCAGAAATISVDVIGYFV